MKFFAIIAGFIAGVLLAPRSGKDTRRDLKQKARKYQAEAEQGLEIAKDAFEVGQRELKTVATEVAKDVRELTSDAKVRAKRNAQHAKVSAQNVETNTRRAWNERPRSKRTPKKDS